MGDRRIKLLYVLVALGVSSCTPTPQRTLKRAQRYFPALFEPDTVAVVSPPATTEIDCDTIVKYDTVKYALMLPGKTKDSIRVEFRTVYKYKDKPIPYAVYRVLSKEDSVNISKATALTVDCPDTLVTLKRGVIIGQKKYTTQVLAGGVIALFLGVILGMWLRGRAKT